MKSKKADVAINTIVYIAIAVVVLVLIVMYTTGMFGKLGGSLARQGPQELQTIKDACTAACNNAKMGVEINGVDTWKNSDYCTRINSFDKDGDGVKDSLNCWSEPANVQCGTSAPLPAPEKELSADGVETGITLTQWSCKVWEDIGCACRKQGTQAA